MADQPVGAATQDAYGHTSTANQDAALQSLSVAQRALGAGELEKALKFARKSVSLYDTLVGRQLLAKLEKPSEAAPQPASTAEPPAAPAPAPAPAPAAAPAAAPASSSSPPAAEAPSQAAEAGGSSEAEAVVARVLAASTFYDVFGLPNKAPEAAVRKTYRRLAASLHPDRNTAQHPNPSPSPNPNPSPSPKPNPHPNANPEQEHGAAGGGGVQAGGRGAADAGGH